MLPEVFLYPNELTHNLEQLLQQDKPLHCRGLLISVARAEPQYLRAKTAFESPSVSDFIRGASQPVPGLHNSSHKTL